MALTPEIEKEILQVYEQTRRSPFKTARQVGVSINEVFEVLNKNTESLEKASERHGGMGRPEMQKYLVARRKVAVRQWDNSSEEIAEARQNYANGTHELCTGRDGPWLLLYSIPRQRPVSGRERYFEPQDWS